jgi:hypothetical protein
MISKYLNKLFSNNLEIQNSNIYKLKNELIFK